MIRSGCAISIADSTVAASFALFDLPSGSMPHRSSLSSSYCQPLFSVISVLDSSSVSGHPAPARCALLVRAVALRSLRCWSRLRGVLHACEGIPPFCAGRILAYSQAEPLDCSGVSPRLVWQQFWSFTSSARCTAGWLLAHRGFARVARRGALSSTTYRIVRAPSPDVQVDVLRPALCGLRPDHPRLAHDSRFRRAPRSPVSRFRCHAQRLDWPRLPCQRRSACISTRNTFLFAFAIWAFCVLCCRGSWRRRIDPGAA